LRTHIADPAPTKRDTPEAHGAPLGTEEVKRTKEIMGWPTEPTFYVPDEAVRAVAACRRGRRPRAG
jgi:transketolase